MSQDFRVLGESGKPAERILSLAPSFTDTLLFLGLDQKIVGVTANCEPPKELGKLPTCGSFASPDIEKIAKLKPDLTLVLGRIHAPYLKELLSYSKAVLTLDANTVAGILNTMVEINRLADGSRKGEDALTTLRQRYDAVVERVKTLNKPRVFRMMTEDPMVTATTASFQYNAIEVAGGQPMLLDYGEPYTAVTTEEIIDFDPEVIISCGRSYEQAVKKSCENSHSDNPICLSLPQDIIDNNHWKETSAAKTERAYAISCQFICHPSPSLMDGIEKMSALFHPEVATDDNISK
jgi:iron complex transport system substrate-binding protein